MIVRPATEVGNKSLRALTSLIGNMSLKEQKEQLTFVKTNVSKTNWDSERYYFQQSAINPKRVTVTVVTDKNKGYQKRLL